MSIFYISFRHLTIISLINPNYQQRILKHTQSNTSFFPKSQSITSKWKDKIITIKKLNLNGSLKTLMRHSSIWGFNFPALVRLCILNLTTVPSI